MRSITLILQLITFLFLLTQEVQVNAADTDNDGMSDEFEIENGFDPNDGSDCPSWYCGGGSKIWLYQILLLDTDQDGIPDRLDLDDDNDGMPDEYEIEHGLNPLLDDAALDLDNDGSSNLEEYLAGTPPNVYNPPVANAGIDIEVNELTLVNLDGSSSTGKIATYHWSQLSGISVTLSDVNIESPNFTSPNVEQSETLIFQITVTDNDGATSSDSVNITIAPVYVTISIEDNADVVEIISGSLGSLIPDANNSVVIDRTSYETLIGTIDSNGNLALMALTNGTDIELSGLSTVRVLLNFVPSIYQVFNEYPNLFNNQIAPLPAIVALSNYISANPDWSAEQLQFEALFITALEATLLNLEGLTQPLIKDVNPSTKVIHLGDELTGDAKSYSLQKFRTKVTMLPNVDSNGGYQIQVENLSYMRWLVGMVTDTPYSGELGVDSPFTFYLPSESGLFTRLLQDYPSNISDVISVAEYPSDTAKQSTYGVYVYGLSLGDIANIPTTGKAAEAYWRATGYTILFDYVMPMIALASPALDDPDCIAEFFDIQKMNDPLSQGLAKSIASSAKIRQFITDGQYSDAGVEALILVSEVIINTGIKCLINEPRKYLLKKVLVKYKDMDKLLKKYNLFATAVELGIKLPNVIIEQTEGKSERFFKISNTGELTNEFVGRDSVLTDSIFVGYSWQNDLAEFDPSITVDYLGNCVNDNPNGICSAYSFDSELPYIIDFTVSCNDPATGDIVPCASVEIVVRFKDDSAQEFKYQDSTADADGKFRFEYQVNKIGEYVGEIISTDIFGGISSQNHFNIQIKRAQPQVSIYRDGMELAYTIDNGVLSLISPIDVSPEGNATSKSIDLEIVNTGFGTATIDSFTAPQSTAITTDIATGSIAGSKLQMIGRQALTINYTQPNNVTDIADELIILGSLGNKSVHSAVTQNSINSIRIPLIYNGAPDIKVVLEGVDVPSSNTLVAHDFGDVIAYKISPFSMTISNEGGTPLNINRIRGTDGWFQFVDVDFTGPVDIEPNGSINVTGSYTMWPVLGLQEATITITSDDPVDSDYHLLLSANVVPPAPPIFTMGAIQCVGNNHFATFDYKVESEAIGTLDFRTYTPTGAQRWNTVSGWGVGGRPNSIYSGIVGVCASWTFGTTFGGNLIIKMFDEFGQGSEMNYSFEECSYVNHPPFVWDACAEYH